MNELATDVPHDVFDELAAFRYREKFHLSATQLAEEPIEAIRQAAFIWSLDNERAKLEERRRDGNARQN